MIENLGENDLQQQAIPLLQIDSLALEKILEWTDKWKNTPQPTAEEIKNKTKDSIDPWDEEFLKMPLRELYELVKKISF